MPYRPVRVSVTFAMCTKDELFGFSSDSLREFGEDLFGEHWHGPLAAMLNVETRSVRRWETNERPIPIWAIGKIMYASHSESIPGWLEDQIENEVDIWKAEHSEHDGFPRWFAIRYGLIVYLANYGAVVGIAIWDTDHQRFEKPTLVLSRDEKHALETIIPTINNREPQEVDPVSPEDFTPEVLASYGEMLFGKDWTTGVAQMLNVRGQTVRRWASGKVRIPGWVSGEMMYVSHTQAIPNAILEKIAAACDEIYEKWDVDHPNYPVWIPVRYGSVVYLAKYGEVAGLAIWDSEHEQLIRVHLPISQEEIIDLSNTLAQSPGLETPTVAVHTPQG